MRKLRMSTLVSLDGVIQDPGGQEVTGFTRDLLRDVPVGVPAVEVAGLTRDFGGRRALDDVTFGVARGEVFGVLGPNGAGKSTLMRVLLGLLRPTGGRAWVAGLDVAARPAAVRARVGWVPQERSADLLLTARENVVFIAGLCGLSARCSRERAGQVLGLAGLGEHAGRLAGDLSGGLRRRLEVAMGVVHRPEVLFLDEPTLGLDIAARRGVWAYLDTVRRSGVTTVLATHYLEEADALCDRVAVIDRGRVRAVGAPAELKQRFGAASLALLAQPLVWLVLFGHLFAAMARTGAVPGGYLQFMTAGAVVMTTFNACLQGGVELLFDRESGTLARMLATPAHRLSVVTSRFIFLTGVTGAQGLVILLAAQAMGVRNAGGVAGIAACLLIGAAFGAGVTALSMALAFSVRSHAQFFPITGFAGLPLTFASSALVLVALMPGWLRPAADANPLTYATDAVRSLVLDGWQPGRLAAAGLALLAFEGCCAAVAALALRRALR